MGIVAIIIHSVNHLINFKVFAFLVIPAIVSSIFASNFSNGLPESILKTIFGIFLIAIACYELGVAVHKTSNRRKPILKNNLNSNF